MKELNNKISNNLKNHNISMKLKFLMFGGVILAMTACSDDNLSNGGDNNLPSESTLNTASYFVEKSDQSRVINYNDFNSKTRASIDFEMPDVPPIPADAKSLEGTYGTLQSGTSYVTGNYTGGWIPNGATIYVTGDVSIDWWNVGTGGATIYIMPGATFKFNSTITPGTTIYNWGSIEGNITVANDVTIYSSGALIFDELGMNAPEGGNHPAKIFSKEIISAKNIRLNGEIYACGLIAENEVTLNDNGTFKIGYIKAKNLTLNAANIILDDNGLIDVKEKILFSNEFTRISVDGKKAVMAAYQFDTNNKEWPKQQIAPEVWVVMEKLTINGNSTYWIDGYNIDHEPWWVPGEEKEYELTDFGLQNNDINSDNAWVPEEGCHLSFGKVPEIPEEPGETLPTWQLIKTGEIEESPEPGHDHNSDKEGLRRLSATCIDGDGTNFYASYHMRGKNYDGQDWADSKDETEGCIEYFTVDENGDITLQSFMWTQDYDFNHILLDSDKILTVGHSQKQGGVLGQLPLSFSSSIGDNDNFSYTLLTTSEKKLIEGNNGYIVGGFKSAGDGNCIIKIGNEYFITTSKGYLKVIYDEESGTWIQTRDYSDREKGTPIFGSHNNASVKHIIEDGQGGVIMLALDNPHPSNMDYFTSSTASLIRYNNSDLANFPAGNPTTTPISDPAISPVDGKNVIALDPTNTNRLYACMGNGGLAVIDNGNVTTIWKHKYSKAEDPEKVGQPSNLPVNGVAVDNSFIYVANGNLVSVLDKDSLEEIANYHADANISANYIKLSGNYIYVAYGQDGILQLQLRKI